MNIIGRMGEHIQGHGLMENSMEKGCTLIHREIRERGNGIKEKE